MKVCIIWKIADGWEADKWVKQFLDHGKDDSAFLSDFN